MPCLQPPKHRLKQLRDWKVDGQPDFLTEIDSRRFTADRKFLRFQPLHDFAHVLRAVARAEQQRVLGFHDDQVANPDRGDEFLRAPEKISLRVERDKFSGGNIFSGFPREQFVDGGPGTDVAPAHFRGQNEDAGRRRRAA